MDIDPILAMMEMSRQEMARKLVHMDHEERVETMLLEIMVQVITICGAVCAENKDVRP